MKTFDKEEIKVSIIVPVYNVEQYLDDCLQSLMNQTLQEIEIICVNDGSTDGSLAILEKNQKNDNRINIVTQKNQGLAAARNTGIMHAKGKYIIFCDSDDMLKRNSAEKLYDLAEENDTQIVCFDSKCLYMTEELAKNDNKDYYYQRSISYGLDTGKEIFTRMMEDNSYCDSACLMFINRNWLEDSGLSFYAGILYEDCLFSVQCMMKAENVYHINEQFYIYRVREGSIMTSKVGADNLYGRLINVHYFKEILFSEKLTERQEWALVEFTRIVGYHAERLARGLNAEETEKLLQKPLTNLMKLELEKYGVNANLIRKSIQKERLNRILDQAESIEIYGAGVRGRRMLVYLHLNGYGNKVSNFVVSARENQVQKIDGLDILSVEEGWKPSENKLVILSFAGEEAKEIFIKYRNQNITNLFLLDGEYYRIVVQDVKKQLLM